MHSLRPPFAQYVAPARPRSELWRTLLGACLIAAIYVGFATGLFALLQWVVGISLDLDAARPIGMMVFLATFIGMALGPVLMAVWLHARAPSSLFGRAAWVLRDFSISTVTVAGLFAISVALWSIWFDAVPNLDVGLWLTLLPISLLALLLQTGAEELVFRGYLQQQLAARFATPLAWAVVPSLLFGLAHFDPESSGVQAWLMVLATGLFGLAAADLTARTGSLGAAWGFHFANNCLAVLVLGVQGPLTGLALFTTPYAVSDPIMQRLLLVDMATVVLAWLVLRRLLSR